MNYYLPTYEECQNIIKSNGDMVFYEYITYIDNYKVSLFNYRLANIKSFTNPIENSDITAFELRGLCFVFNTDGTLYNRFLLFNKFFNLNQAEFTLKSIVDNYIIDEVYEKMDGSVVSFIKLPNGRVLGRSKMSFETDQANAANDVYNNNIDVKRLVDYFLENDITPIFEYVSHSNRIVIL